MSVEMISVKCPECGAALSLEEGRKEAFCTYCGAKILVHNDNEYTVNIRDDANIKYAETDQIVSLKKIEMMEKAAQDRKNVRKIKIIISLVLATVGIIMMTAGYGLGSLSGNSDSGFYMLAMVGFFPLLGAAYIWLFSSNDDDEIDPFSDKAKIPSGINGFEKKSYQAIESLLRGAGFTDVTCVPLNNLTVGILKKPGMVESITVGGKEITSGGKKYSKDAPVVITYHSSRINKID